MSEKEIDNQQRPHPEQLLDVQSTDFELPSGYNLTERYTNAVVTVMEDLQKNNPGFVGFTAFGSFARGEARVKDDGSYSDIRALIIDADIHPDIRGALVDKADGIGAFPLSDTGPGMDLRVTIKNKLMDAAGVPADPDIDLVVVSQELTQEVPRTLLKNAEEPEGQWSTTDESVKEFLRYFANRDFITPLFMVDVFGSEELSKYRKMVIDVLAEGHAEKPRITERAWYIIKMYVSQFEKGKEGNGMSRPFPATLAEAIELYR